jgi:AhpD family alkylhydroperoxidase
MAEDRGLTDRIALAELAPRQLGAMAELERAIELEPGLRHLVKLRASQMNGCGYCIDMHWREARAQGEPDERLYGLDAWRESPLYDRRERAALALCEGITRIADGHVPDAVWSEAAAALDPEELAQLVFQVTAINAWNRLAITTRMAAPVRGAAAAA